MQWIFNDGGFSCYLYLFFCFLLAFNKFGLGHPKGFALFISAEAGLEMIYLIFMVYLYHRFSSGVSYLSQPVPILL